MRLAVTREKALQAQYVRMVRSSDDDRPTRPAFQQAHTAQDQRSHDALTKLSLLNHQIS